MGMHIQLLVGNASQFQSQIHRENNDFIIRFIYDWDTIFLTKELKTMSHWITMFIMIYY